jgi:hypothetical protein
LTRAVLVAAALVAASLAGCGGGMTKTPTVSAPNHHATPPPDGPRTVPAAASQDLDRLSDVVAPLHGLYGELVAAVDAGDDARVRAVTERYAAAVDDVDRVVPKLTVPALRQATVRVALAHRAVVDAYRDPANAPPLRAGVAIDRLQAAGRAMRRAIDAQYRQ